MTSQHQTTPVQTTHDHTMQDQPTESPVAEEGLGMNEIAYNVDNDCTKKHSINLQKNR